jgi:hypothetical protein
VVVWIELIWHRLGTSSWLLWTRRNVGKFLSNWAIGGFSSRAQLHGFSLVIPCAQPCSSCSVPFIQLVAVYCYKAVFSTGSTSTICPCLVLLLRCTRGLQVSLSWNNPLTEIYVAAPHIRYTLQYLHKVWRFVGICKNSLIIAFCSEVSYWLSWPKPAITDSGFVEHSMDDIQEFVCRSHGRYVRFKRNTKLKNY